MGIQVMQSTEAGCGLRVYDVGLDTAAAEVGVEAGDVITAVEGRAIDAAAAAEAHDESLHAQSPAAEPQTAVQPGSSQMSREERADAVTEMLLQSLLLEAATEMRADKLHDIRVSR